MRTGVLIAPVTTGRAHVAATDTRPWRNASTNSAWSARTRAA